MVERHSVRRGWRLLAGASALLACYAFPSVAQARPEAPRAFCETYPEVPECAGVVVTCDTCHLSTDPPSWNGFGLDLLAELGPLTADGTSFEEALPEALQLIELEDSDGDGVSNRDEILVGTQAGDATSVWLPDPGGEDAGEGEGEVLPNPWYALGEYDPAFALRRVLVLYCGRSPTYEQLQEFVALGETSGAEAQRTRLHEHLSSCLAGEWWRTTGVTELADPKVKPIKAVGSETKVEIAGFRVVLADYDWDYRLWRWIMTEDRDVRDLLLADYHVVEGEDGGLEIITGAIGDPTNLGQLAGGQPLQPDKRAGMMTTQWFLMSNTMFSALPRTTAAQAYRAYLGMDISMSEGILPVANEPSDVDHKGVAQEACAACHSTLDPLSYAFAYYTGIILPSGTGLYSESRPANEMPDWDPEVHRSVLFGEPVDDLLGWAAVAVESDAFKRNLAQMLFEHALGRGPGPGEHEEFDLLWQSLATDGWSANALIHRLVDTEAFGAP